MTSRDVSDELLGQLARRQHDLFRRVREGSIPFKAVMSELQIIIEKGRGDHCIKVPKLSSTALAASAEKRLGLSNFSDEGYADYDFVKDEGGKTFEVLTWSPGRWIETDEVLKHFSKLHADGNPAAFVAWVAEKDPEGDWVTIPSVKSRLSRFSSMGGRFTPSYERVGDHRQLKLRNIECTWRNAVAFREVT